MGFLTSLIWKEIHPTLKTQLFMGMLLEIALMGLEVP